VGVGYVEEDEEDEDRLRRSWEIMEMVQKL